jgi:hypothetical protein
MLLMHGENKKGDQSRRKFRLTGKELTRLEDEGASDIHVPTIARWFDTLIGAQ